jgi:hypothetical protein
MSKNKRKGVDRKLRQKIEILKAQLKVEPESRNAGQNPTRIFPEKTVNQKKLETDDVNVKKDLLKTLVLSAFGFAVILVLWSFDITGFRF